MFDDETEEVRDEGGTGSEGQGSKDDLPAAPSEDDDTPLGDTDQHSEAPSPPAQTGGPGG
ncbi:MAG: hypothetical protein H0T43_03185 [Solirubrobacterales bacterium]|nr:hypothetical protein [Solirubrobacterales bacterium]